MTKKKGNNNGDQNLKFFIITSTMFWSTGKNINEAFENLKGMTSIKCEIYIKVTNDLEAKVSGIDGSIVYTLNDSKNYVEIVGHYNWNGKNQLTLI